MHDAVALFAIKTLAAEGLVRVDSLDMVQFMAGLAIGFEDVVAALTSATTCEAHAQFEASFLVSGGTDLVGAPLRMIVRLEAHVLVVAFDSNV